MEMSRIKAIIPIVLLYVFISGCIRQSDADVNYVDFAHAAADYMNDRQNSDSLNTIIDRNIGTFETMSEMLGLPPNSNINDWLGLPAVSGFAHDVSEYAPSEEQIKDGLRYIQTAASKENIELPVRKFASVIWGRPQSIMFADSTMFIALNHYLGSDHPAYASLPSYRLNDKRQKALSYDVVEALLSTSYPFQHNESSAVINRLVYEGAIVEAKMRLIKGATLSDALGYTEDQLDWLEENEGLIWRKMNEAKLLFDHSEEVVHKLVSPAPFTSPISYETPGRAGRFIGYKIAKSYIDRHNGTELKYLLSPEFYGVMNPLIGSGYNPL